MFRDSAPFSEEKQRNNKIETNFIVFEINLFYHFDQFEVF